MQEKKVGFLAGEDFTPNPIEEKKKQRIALGLPLIDLSDSNPTHNGLLFPPTILEKEAARYLQTRSYDPDPKGLIQARQAVSEYYQKRVPALDIRPQQIFLTASTSESYGLLFSLLAEPGDAMLAPALSYPLFDLLAEHHRVSLLPYSFTDASTLIPEETISSAAKARAILVISPHNPTGRTAQATLPALAETSLPLISDEVFADFPYNVPAVPPLGALYPNQPVFHLGGISKMFALPDLKLGWIALNKSAFTHYGERLEFLNDTFLGASTLIQSMLPRIFSESSSFRAQLQERIRSNITICCKKLNSLPNVQCPVPEAGAFVFPQFDINLDEEEFAVRLIERGVFAHPGYFYGSEHGVRLMISCIITPENLRKGLEIIADALSNL